MRTGRVRKMLPDAGDPFVCALGRCIERGLAGSCSLYIRIFVAQRVSRDRRAKISALPIPEKDSPRLCMYECAKIDDVNEIALPPRTGIRVAM